MDLRASVSNLLSSSWLQIVYQGCQVWPAVGAQLPNSGKHPAHLHLNLLSTLAPPLHHLRPAKP